MPARFLFRFRILSRLTYQLKLFLLNWLSSVNGMVQKRMSGDSISVLVALALFVPEYMVLSQYRKNPPTQVQNGQ